MHPKSACKLALWGGHGKRVDRDINSRDIQDLILPSLAGQDLEWIL